MKLKLLGALTLSSALLLTACGDNQETDKKEDTKTKEAQTTESKDKKETKNDSNENTETKSSDEQDVASDEQSSSPQENMNDATEEGISQNNNVQDNSMQSEYNQNAYAQINPSNITDQSTLENVIYGNYTEEQKIEAYNSAVANGVIPQGTVMEGPTHAAYESSVKIQNGISYEDQMAQRYQSWVDAGLMTEEEMQEELSKL